MEKQEMQLTEEQQAVVENINKRDQELGNLYAVIGRLTTECMEVEQALEKMREELKKLTEKSLEDTKKIKKDIEDFNLQVAGETVEEVEVISE